MTKKYRGTALSLVLLSSGCNFEQQAKQLLVKSVRFLQGKSKSDSNPSPIPQAGDQEGLIPQQPRETDEAYRKRQRRHQANSQLLREVYSVVFLKEPKNKATFGNYLDSMNQGASLEGIYNGFTHSSVWRELERNHPGAPAHAIDTFGKALALIELSKAKIRQFGMDDTKPLAEVVAPSYRSTPGAESEDSSSGESSTTGSTAKPSQEELASRYSQQFIGASLFTLKRILGDEALVLVNEKSNYKENLALWYSKWVVQMSRFNVNYGLSQRNLADEKFHYNWALKADTDRVVWEVLNRVHRVLNESARRK